MKRFVFQLSVFCFVALNVCVAGILGPDAGEMYGNDAQITVWADWPASRIGKVAVHKIKEGATVRSSGSDTVSQEQESTTDLDAPTSGWSSTPTVNTNLTVKVQSGTIENHLTIVIEGVQ